MTDFLHLPIATGLETAPSVGSEEGLVAIHGQELRDPELVIDEIVTLGFATL